MGLNKTLIIIPSFNERENIVQLIDRLFELYHDIDILVVDDSSPDGTADVVKEAQARQGEKLRLLVRQGKGGRGSAVMDGCKMALVENYDVIIEMDADFSHKPEEVQAVRDMLGLNCDCVIGSRYVHGSEIREWGRRRIIFSKLANRFARFILGIPINDYTNGFRAYTRRALASIDFSKIDATGYVVLSEFAWQLHKRGFQFAEVPTLFVNRRRGASNLGFHEINEAFFSVLRIRWPEIFLLSHQLGPFMLRGLIGAVVDVGSLWILARFLSVNLLMSFILSSLIAGGVMLGLQRRRWGGHPNVPFERYVMLYAMIAVGCVMLTIPLWTMGMNYLVAKALAIMIVAPISYFLRKIFFGR